MQPYSVRPQCVPAATSGPYAAEVDAWRAATESDVAAIRRAMRRLHARQTATALTPDAETFDRLDAMVDTDPIGLRDVAWQMVRELAEVRAEAGASQ